MAKKCPWQANFAAALLYYQRAIIKVLSWKNVHGIIHTSDALSSRSLENDCSISESNVNYAFFAIRPETKSFLSRYLPHKTAASKKAPLSKNVHGIIICCKAASNEMRLYLF